MVQGPIEHEIERTKGTFTEYKKYFVGMEGKATSCPSDELE